MKILVVDFDIIMYPCIRLYDKYVEQGINDRPDSVWDILEEEFGINKFVSYDANVLLKIAELIKHTVSDGAKFISVDNNKAIVEDLLYDNKNIPDNSIDITSIDCHHCLINSDAELQKIYDFGEYNSLSWIGYLFSRNKVGNYMWITAPCSTSADIDKLQSLFSFEKKSINTVNLLEDNFDKVYFVRSEHWIPYKYRHLFNLIASLVAEENL